MNTSESIADPHPAHARLRDGAAVHLVGHPDGSEYWLVTRYAEARATLTDDRLSPAPPGPAAAAPQRTGELRGDLPAHEGDPRDLPARGGNPRDGLNLRADELLDKLAAHGGGDLIEDFARPLAGQVAGAGDAEVVTNLIGTGMITLFRHPAQRAALRARPGLMSTAIEELVRYDGPIVLSAPRRAPVELRIGGVRIPAGGTVVVGLAAANRDPRRFPDPDRLDLTRADDGHLGFGHGPHLSPAAAPARLVGPVAIGALLARFPRLALAVPPADLPWLPDPAIRGVSALPVTTG